MKNDEPYEHPDLCVLSGRSPDRVTMASHSGERETDRFECVHCCSRRHHKTEAAAKNLKSRAIKTAPDDFKLSKFAGADQQPRAIHANSEWVLQETIDCWRGCALPRVEVEATASELTGTTHLEV